MKHLLKRKEQVHACRTFAKDPLYVEIIDLIARHYGQLPSEVTKLSWEDMLINLHCIQARSKRLQKMLKKKGNKKGAMIFPTINMSDLADLI